MEQDTISTKCEYLARAIRMLNQKWSIEIILSLYAHGTLRFNELKKFCVSQFRGTLNSRTLANRLQLFQLRGLVERIDPNELPIHVGYRLTDDGKCLAENLCRILNKSIRTISSKSNTSLLNAAELNYLCGTRASMDKLISGDSDVRNHMGEVIKKVEVQV